MLCARGGGGKPFVAPWHRTRDPGAPPRHGVLSRGAARGFPPPPRAPERDSFFLLTTEPPMKTKPETVSADPIETRKCRGFRMPMGDPLDLSLTPPGGLRAQWNPP